MSFFKKENILVKVANSLSETTYDDISKSDILSYARDKGVVILYGNDSDKCITKGAIERNSLNPFYFLDSKKNVIFLNQKGNSVPSNSNSYSNKSINASISSDGSVSYKTSIPHEEFSIFSKGKKICTGIVFLSKNLSPIIEVKSVSLSCVVPDVNKPFSSSSLGSIVNMAGYPLSKKKGSDNLSVSLSIYSNDNLHSLVEQEFLDVDSSVSIDADLAAYFLKSENFMHEDLGELISNGFSNAGIVNFNLSFSVSLKDTHKSGLILPINIPDFDFIVDGYKFHTETLINKNITDLPIVDIVSEEVDFSFKSFNSFPLTLAHLRNNLKYKHENLFSDGHHEEPSSIVYLVLKNSFDFFLIEHNSENAISQLSEAVNSYLSGNGDILDIISVEVDSDLL